MILETIFWLLFLGVGYTYAGYGIVISLLAKIKPRPIIRDKELRSVTLLIAAYNEEEVIEAKIRNSLALNYPRNLLQIVVVSDGSTDNTLNIVQRYSREGIISYHSPVRAGKLAALKRVLELTDSEIVIFSDANAFYNPDSLAYLVAPFADPTVGGVAGEKRVQTGDSDQSGSGEGLYWRYESYLKKKDSVVYSVVGAAGEIFAVRRSLISWPPSNAVIEDFVMSMLIVRQGYRIVYEPQAQAIEKGSSSLKADFERRARIACGGFQAIWWLRDLCLPRYGIVAFQYVSHRAMRWAIAPLALLLLIPLNIFLATSSLFYASLLGLQILFYAMAGFGIYLSSRGRKIRLLSVPGYFVITNLSALIGLYRFCTGRQAVTWKKISHNVPAGFE
jgi:biofilm PGA synthesis N-glycosyltransferase PgaC